MSISAPILILMAAVTFLFVRSTLMKSAPRVSPQEAQKLSQDGKALLVDVREREEIQAGMLEGALWLPLSGLQTGTSEVTSLLQKIDPKMELLLYCRSGRRSDWVAKMLSQKGYKTRNLGGFTNARDAGLATHIPSPGAN